MTDIPVGSALFAGMMSFLSPCTLPLYPSYLTYITGLSYKELSQEPHNTSVRVRIVTHTLTFVMGLSLVFYSLGYGAGFIGEWFIGYREIIRKVSAIFIMVMGLMIAGILGRPSWMMKERRVSLGHGQAGYLSSLLFGIGFAAGWTPCVGPILASIITVAASHPSAWFSLMTAYSVGFAVPFLILAFYIGSVRWLSKYGDWIQKVGGVFMVIVGMALLSGRLGRLTIWLQKITPEWLIF